MYFYSIEKLKTRLAEGPLPEKESVTYVIGFAAITALTGLLPTVSDTWHYVNGSISVLLAFIGTYWIYLQNGGAEGDNFIHRYIVLGWVSVIRYLTFAAPAFIIVLAAAHYFFALAGTRVDWLYYPAIAIFEALFYTYFGRQFIDLMQKTKAHGSLPKS
ncbi:MAG TPA: hypothetical protein VK985_05295 [Rariglobus sp.]|nr:hypothetical protein [Rariglobus sp.]